MNTKKVQIMAIKKKKKMKKCRLLLIEICFGVLGLKNKTSNIIIFNISKELFISSYSWFFPNDMDCFSRSMESW